MSTAARPARARPASAELDRGRLAIECAARNSQVPMRERDRKPTAGQPAWRPARPARFARRGASSERLRSSAARARGAGAALRLAHGEGGAGKSGAAHSIACWRPRTPLGGSPTKAAAGGPAEMVRPDAIAAAARRPMPSTTAYTPRPIPCPRPSSKDRARGHRAGARPDHRSAQCRRHPAHRRGVSRWPQS